jgi:hypothetical protein
MDPYRHARSDIHNLQSLSRLFRVPSLAYFASDINIRAVPGFKGNWKDEIAECGVFGSLESQIALLISCQTPMMKDL